MIGYIKGEIGFKSPTYIYLETHGVGYHINISLHTYEGLENIDRVKMFTHLHVKEDEQTLYGFLTEVERAIFKLLISVSGIGPNTALVVLSSMTPGDVKQAIVNDNVAAINKVKGIGPKTAKLIILNLKDKILKEGIEKTDTPGIMNNTMRDEALSALIALGFQKAMIEKRIEEIIKTNPEITQVEELIKLVLRQMR